jgi:hypothetical protein
MVARHRHPLLLLAALGLLSVIVAPAYLPAEGLSAGVGESVTDSLWQLPSSGMSQADPGSRSPRVRLFRIAPAFTAEPLGLYEPEDILGKTSKTEPAATDDGPDWLQVWMGADNPFLDFRQPGDPGGLGFYRITTQVQLFESARSGCALTLQTVTPSGIQYWGLPEGTTVCSPSLSVFHAVDRGLSLQGFVSKNVVVCDAAVNHGLQRRVQCGLGLQQLLAGDCLYCSLEGLAQTPADHRALEMPPSLQLLPGMQWQLDEAWWLSSGLLMPVGPQHHRPGQWQMTCSFQF